MEAYINVIWAVIMVLLLVIEACTAQLVTIWFALGALAGLIASFVTESIWIQICSAIIVSVISVIVTRPFVKKIHSKKMQPTNADRIIGQNAIVSEEINNDKGTGQVRVSGIVWSARSSDGTVISEEETVIVERIEGVKLIVSKNKNI